MTATPAIRPAIGPAVRPASLPRRLQELLAVLVDLMLPRSCAGCGRSGYAACARCAAALAGPPVLAAPGPTASPGRRGHDARRPLRPPPRGVAAAPFEGTTRVLLLAYKERGRLDLAHILGAALARAVAAVTREHRRRSRSATVVVVPVPTTPAARRRRGFDHVARLAEIAARALTRSGTPARVSRVLRVLRPGLDQAGLGAAARRRNRSGAFAVRPGARPRTWPEIVVVVDDIVTTGATLAEAVRALRVAGWAPVGTAAVAATPLRRLDLRVRRAIVRACPP
ncbi:putative amidophosphoribosyltransferase [Frankia sp. EI5c]|uniref:ComF family protein n=1 Tax=Frankia sp. EI5c TaxID=683316 RepID=UPI0007C25FCD|nr:phosphoribosyltransferase family protein [Frankia sp. EI5c]OAA19729.1 putative amidophosphoribosyltransferase [Frankia sp. EI5c]